MQSTVVGKWFAVPIVLMFLLGSCTCFDYCKKTCKSAKHTMCLYPKEDPGSLCKNLDSSRGLTDEDKKKLVKQHNELRSTVAQGKETKGDPGPQPSAANMMELVWDEELEIVAKRWSQQCDYKHDACRLTMDGGYVGQNIAVSYDSAGFKNDIEGQVNSWYNEVEFTPKDTANAFVSGSTPSGDIGHYTQLVWAETRKIGCARVYFDFSDWGMSEYLVCNYETGGNIKGKPLYKIGASCSACSGGLPCSDTYPGLCAAPSTSAPKSSSTLPPTSTESSIVTSTPIPSTDILPIESPDVLPAVPPTTQTNPNTTTPYLDLPDSSACSGYLPWGPMVVLMSAIFAMAITFTADF